MRSQPTLVQPPPSSAIRDLLDHAARPGMISLAGGIPDPELLPAEHLAAIAAAVVAEQPEVALQYGRTAGEPDVIEALSRPLFGTAVDDTVETVVTTGAQQALDLLARVLAGPGDVVVAGLPDYVGSLQVWSAVGARIEPVPVDEHGIDTDALAARLRAGLRPVVCTVVPQGHNPTGATLCAERHRHLAALADRYGFRVVEDDPYRELYFDGVAPGPSPVDPQLRIEVRSTSKTLAPGLRIGALRAPADVAAAVVATKQRADLHTSTLCQLIAARAVTADWYPAHLDRLRSELRMRRDAMTAALDDRFAGRARYWSPTAGMFVWMQLDRAVSLSAALDAGVCFVPGDAFVPPGHADGYGNRVRLSFASGSPARLVEGVGRLAALD